MKNWLFLFVAIISEVIATSALKESQGFTKLLPSAAVVLGYGTAFYFLSLTLKTIPLGVAYSIWCGLGMVLVAVVGWVVFHQKISPATMIGIGFVLVGVVIISLSSEHI